MFRLSVLAIVLAMAGCHGRAGPTPPTPHDPDAILMVDAAELLATVSLTWPSHAALFQWHPPHGFRLLAPDPASGETALLQPGDYLVNSGIQASATGAGSHRLHLVLITSSEPLAVSRWEDAELVRPEGRVVSRRGALDWLVETVVPTPTVTAWTLVEERTGRVMGHAYAQRHPWGLQSRGAGFQLYPGERSQGRRAAPARGQPGTSQPERPPD
jgi:hypothetical protein